MKEASSTNPARLNEPSPMEAEIVKTLDTLFQPGDLVELRMPSASKYGKRTRSGYYDDWYALARDALANDGKTEAIWITLNKVNPQCEAKRPEKNKLFEAEEGTTTSDNDILRRQWLPLDFDPKHPAHTSSSNEQHDFVIAISMQTAEMLTKKFGWPEPLYGDSGNGAHLLYKINLPNDRESKDLISTVVKALIVLVGHQDQIDVDQKIINAARVSKLYGTLAAKGYNIPKYPHRRSRIIKADNIGLVTKEMLQAVATTLPDQRRPKASIVRPATGFKEIDVAEFIDEHNLGPYNTKDMSDGRTGYILERCPFDNSHIRSAQIVKQASGAVGFSCHHNSCSNNHWAELKEHLGIKRATPYTPHMHPRPAPKAEPTEGYEPIAYDGEAATLATEDAEFHGPRIMNGAEFATLKLGDDYEEQDVAEFVLKHTQKHFIVVGKKKAAVVFKYDGKRYVEDVAYELRKTGLEAIRHLVRNHQMELSEKKQTYGDGPTKNQEHELKVLESKVGKLKAYKNLKKVTALEGMMITLMAREKSPDFDGDVRYINAQNGVYDLIEHKLLPHSPEYHMTKILPFDIDPAAECPEFMKVLNNMFRVTEEVAEICGLPPEAIGTIDEETKEWFLEYVASGLLRRRQDDFIVFLHGKRAGNGKTSLLLALVHALGYENDGYGAWMDASTFSKARTRNATSPERMMAKSRCFAVLDEPEDDADGNALKRSMNPFEAFRGLYESTEIHRNEATIVFACNKMPILDTKDQGVVRRIKVIPVFTQVTPEMKNAQRHYEKARLDKTGIYIGTNEAPAIFNVLLEALKRFQARGSRMPPVTKVMEIATDGYVGSHNVVFRVLKERCETDMNPDPEKRPAVNAADFHEVVWNYSSINLGRTDKTTLKAGTIDSIMDSLGFPIKPITRKALNRGVTFRGFDGIRILLEDETSQQEKTWAIRKIVLEKMKHNEGASLDIVYRECDKRHHISKDNAEKAIKKMLEKGELIYGADAASLKVP